MGEIATIDPTTSVATQQRQPTRSVLIDMAMRYGMEPAAFEATLRATVIQKATREEFAAFLLVAKEYGLNPLTKEIYAFPAKGGGIVPVVSIDGWINLIQSHKACDGFGFEMEHDENGNLVSCTCRMYRKDRAHPVVVTEYLGECRRGTEPWKMVHRMLRHKTLIQAGRYAFGFSGIYDEDEAAKIADAAPAPRDEPPAPPPPPSAAVIDASPSVAPDQLPAPIADPQQSGDFEPAPDAAADPEAFVRFVEAKLTKAASGDDLTVLWDRYVEPVRKDLFPSDIDDLMSVYRKQEVRLNG
jgi:phage recombination protein Bet